MVSVLSYVECVSVSMSVVIKIVRYVYLIYCVCVFWCGRVK